VLLAFRTTSGWGNNIYFDNINISNTASVNELEAGKFSIHPNPTSGNVIVDMPASGSITVNISDVTGRIVRTERIANAGTSLEIDLSGQASGTYFLEVKNGVSTYKEKVTVIK
jgi:hypothetical protein